MASGLDFWKNGLPVSGSDGWDSTHNGLDYWKNGLPVARYFGGISISDAGAIASVEAFGNATVTGGAAWISGAGNISSAEAFGTAKLNLNVTTAGDISSVEVFGTLRVNLNIAAAGDIATSQLFGNPNLNLNITAVGDISSLEAFGTAKINLNVVAAGNIATAEVLGSPIMRAVLHPNGDIAIGSWKDQGEGTTDLYAAIDESVISDSDYVKTDVKSSPDTLEVSLGAVSDPGSHVNHTVSYRYCKEGSSKTAQLTVYLMQGETTIAFWTHPDVGETTITTDQLLTEGQAGNITDYADLHLKFEVVEA